MKKRMKDDLPFLHSVPAADDLQIPRRVRCAATLADETGTPLDGAKAYVLHLVRGAPPPTDVSVTLYDCEGFQVVNAFNRICSQ
jgi:hypothetical protein